jgi:hypothetical protein
MSGARLSLRLGLSSMLFASLLGCASVTVHRVTNGDAQAAYELEGTSLAQLDTEAQRLCPRGYDTRREWQSYQRLGNDDVFYVRWWNKLSDTTSAPTGAKAQLAVVCKPAQTAHPAPAPAASAASAP